MEFDPKEVRMTKAQVVSVIPSVDDPEMRVYTVDSVEELVELRLRLTDPQIAEFIADIQVVHWDKEPNNQLED